MDPLPLYILELYMIDDRMHPEKEKEGNELKDRKRAKHKCKERRAQKSERRAPHKIFGERHHDREYRQYYPRRIEHVYVTAHRQSDGGDRTGNRGKNDFERFTSFFI